MLTSASIKYLIPTDFICDITDKFIFSGVQVKDAADNGVEYLLKKHPELVKFQLGERRMFLGEQGEEAIYFTIAGLNTLLSMPGLTSLSIISRIDINPANVTKIMSKQLQTLDLSGIKDIDDAFFLHIVEQCGKTLKFLNLSYSQISGDKLVDCNGALHCLDTLELQKCSRLTVTGLYQIFKSCGKTLRSLNLSESGIFVEFFRSYVEYSGTLACLENLNLSCCQITDKGLLQIFKVCGKTIRSMDLSNTNITGESLVEYSGTLACLENLNLNLCQITDRGLLQIFKVCGKTIRSMDLSNTDITGESLVEYSGTLACLENLNLTECNKITDEGLEQIFKICSKTLRSLGLHYTHITGESLVEYSGTLACLEELGLSECEKITDEGLLQIFKVCGTTLRSLYLDSTYVTGESLVEYSGTLACLENLNGIYTQINDTGLLQIFKVCGTTLRSLDLRNTYITGESLVEFSGTLACLENLDLSNCVRITDEGLLQIFKVCGTSLRSLNLGSTHVTGESLVEYSGILACLKNLNGRSSRITDRGLLQIFKVCGTTLRSLDLCNTYITGESLVEYSGTLPCLEKLNLQSCKITDRGLVKILQHFGKTLRYLYLDRKCQKEENLLKYKKMGLLLDSVTVS